MKMTPDEKIYVLELYGEMDIIDAPFSEHQYIARFFVKGNRRYVCFGETEDEAIDGIYDQLEHRIEIECRKLNGIS